MTTNQVTQMVKKKSANQDLVLAIENEKLDKIIET